MDELKLKIYPGDGSYLHYQDDGESFEYQKGKYNLYKFTQNVYDQNYKVTLEFENKGYNEFYNSFEVEFFNTEITEIKVDEQKINFEKGSQSVTFNIEGDFCKIELLKT
nr:DUF5110 domain-containing protein [Halanaerobium sp. ST460_2HS_T2]